MILVILWPLPMHIGGGIFSEGGLAFWVVLEILWAVIGGVVITVLPVYETLRDLKEAKKVLDMATQSRMLKNGNTIKAPVVETKHLVRDPLSPHEGRPGGHPSLTESQAGEVTV
jgi:hypothetical protein